MKPVKTGLFKNKNDELVDKNQSFNASSLFFIHCRYNDLLTFFFLGKDNCPCENTRQIVPHH